MSWWSALAGPSQPTAKRKAEAKSAPAGTSPPEAEHAGEGASLRSAARSTEGFEAQEALFRPLRSNESGDRGLRPAVPTSKEGGAGARTRDQAAPPPGRDVPEPELPRDFTSEGVLVTWIAQFNQALARRADRAGRNPKLARLVAMGWADGKGLSLDLLRTAAASWKPKAARKGKASTSDSGPQSKASAPPAVTTARVLGMLAESNGVLRGVIDKDYPGKCLQFSEKMLVELGAKRADGSTDREKKTAKEGPLTARYRGKNVKDLPMDLPAGYQICIVSMPEWGFTEVGNHWFVSAGDGFFADNTGGIFTGAGMTSNLRKAAAEQWAARVVDKDFAGGYAKIRAAMAKKFVENNPQFGKYAKSGRTIDQKQSEVKVKRDGKTVRETNPNHKSTTALEAEGRAAIKAFVLGNATYHPRIWVVEPTTRAQSST